MQSIKTIRDLFINDFMSRLQLADADDFKFLLKSYRKLRWLGKDMTLELFGKRRIEGKKIKIITPATQAEKFRSGKISIKVGRLPIIYFVMQPDC